MGAGFYGVVNCSIWHGSVKGVVLFGNHPKIEKQKGGLQFFAAIPQKLELFPGHVALHVEAVFFLGKRVEHGNTPPV
jgi:hypothetical protein